MKDPCTIYTFGFGSNHNATLLKGIADMGSGTYYYIENADTIKETFADCLGGLVSVVAQDISLQVEGLGCTIVKALTAFPSEIGSNKCTIRVRDMCSEEQRDIAVLVRVPSLAAPALDPVPFVRWTVTYRNLLTQSAEQAAVPMTIGRPETATPGPAPAVLDRHRNRMICTDALQEARNLGDANKMEEARKVLTDAIARIEASHTHEDPLCVGLITDLRNCMAQMNDQREYHAKGHKMMAQMSSNHECQRGAAHYSNAAKASMIMKSKR